MKKIFLISLFVAILFFGWFWIVSTKPEKNRVCSDFKISYRLDSKFPISTKMPIFPLIIDVLDYIDKTSNTISISDVYKSSAAVKIIECNISVIKKDVKNTFSIWKYNSLGEGQEFLKLDNYGYQFHIDSHERYITLERSYLGQPDYALVVKSLETKEDVFELPLSEIVAKHPYLESSLGMTGWSANGRYFWGTVFDGAVVLAFVRIDMTTKTWEAFITPPGTLGGDAFNIETGWVTYDDGLPWTGDSELDALNQTARESEGKALNFYLYNVITKEERLLETIDSVSWSFQPEWLSGTELQYQVPGNPDKRYTLQAR